VHAGHFWGFLSYDPVTTVTVPRVTPRGIFLTWNHYIRTKPRFDPGYKIILTISATCGIAVTLILIVFISLQATYADYLLFSIYEILPPNADVEVPCPDKIKKCVDTIADLPKIRNYRKKIQK
jgi:hypothetical protein